MSRRRASCTVAMMARALKAGKLAGVPVAVKWEAATETLTIFPCAPVLAGANDGGDPIADAIAKASL